MASVQVGISSEVKSVLEQYAGEKGCTLGEACERLITTAVGRLTAVRKYAKKIAKEGGAKPAKKAAKKAAPKAKAPKAKAKKAKAAPAEATIQ